MPALCFPALSVAADLNGLGFRILEKTAGHLVFEWSAPELVWQQMAIDGKDYLLPQMGSLPLVQNPGQPQLPVDALLLEMAPQQSYTVNLLDSVVAFESVGRICPAPLQQITSRDDVRLLYDEDQVIYGSSAFSPQLFLSHEMAVAREKHLLRIAVHPIQYSPAGGSIRRLRYLRGEVRFESSTIRGKSTSTSKSTRMSRSSSRRTEQTENWYDPSRQYLKLFVVEQGVYAVSGQEMQDAGVGLSEIAPASISLLHQGGEQPCQVTGSEDGRFDAADQVLFFAERRAGEKSYYSAYCDTNVYWLTWGQGEGKRFQSTPSASSAQTVLDVFPHVLHWEQDVSYYFGDSDLDIHRSDVVPGEGWIWHTFNRGDAFTIPFDLPGLSWSQDSVAFRLRIRGTTLSPNNPDHHVRFSVNGNVLKDVLANDRDDRIVGFSAPPSMVKEAGNQMEIRSVGDLNAERTQFYLDWIEARYRSSTTADNGWLEIGALDSSSTAKLFVNGFAGDSITVWDLAKQRAVQPQKIGKQWIAHIEVESAGFSDGNHAYFQINGQYVFFGGRGHNLVVLNSETGAIIDLRNFDTWGEVGQADSMAAYVNGLADGSIVLAAVRDEGSAHMTEAAHLALQSLGSTLSRQIGVRDSWALIGRKGAASSAVVEMLKPSTQGAAIVKQTVLFPAGGNSFAVTFADSLSLSARYVCFEPRGLKTPARAILKKPSNLRSPDNAADYLVITHPAFQDYAQQLADYRHRTNGLRTQVVLVEDIYDEFSAGLTDPQAIRDFVQYAYENWQRPAPLYLLFFGDASWDPKRHLAEAVKYDYVPSYGNPVSDLWFVCLDGPNDLVPELNVGRLPVENTVQAGQAVAKIITYESTPSAAWKKNFLFISGGFDSFEQSIFSQQSIRLANEFVQPPPASGRVLHIFKHAQGLQEGEHRQDILDSLNAGVFWTNFIGHAGSRTWDLMFHNPDIDELANGPRYPFISSMTCHTGRFAEPDQTSFGEQFLLAPEKGAIAFWGTSGWGYSYEDYLFLRKLYPIVLQDTVRQVGEAISRAKIALWQAYGSSAQIRNLVMQYNLMGDPALTLALPVKPDPALSAADIALDPLLPSEADSAAEVTLRVQNFGLATTDSLEIALYANHQSLGRQQIGGVHLIKQLGLADSLEITWPLRNMAGSVELEAILDPNNRFDEADENNNRQTTLVTVLSSHIQLLAPVDNALVPHDQVILKIQNPQAQALQEQSCEFQLDTSRTFSSPLYQSSGPIPARPLVTTWKLPSLPAGITFYWRARNVTDLAETFAVHGQLTTNAENQYGWRQAGTEPNGNTTLQNVEWTPEGAQLSLRDLVILVQSQGLFNDTRYAVIQINSDLALPTGRGHNLVVMNPENGKIVQTGHFDIYADPAALDNLIAAIEAVPTGALVIDAIDDEGSGLNERAYQAFESLGSAYCRQIKFRDSWAIIGYKGAAIGSVLESYMPNGSGPAILRDTLTVRAASGTVLASLIGPTEKWHKLSWQADVPSNCDFSVSVLGQKKLTGSTDTLISRATNVSELSLLQIDAQKYPFISLMAHFSTRKKEFTPALKAWQVTHDPVPDLAIGHQVFSQSADTVLVGEPVRLQLQVHNIGQAPTDSVEICFEESDPVAGRKVFASQTLNHTIPIDSFLTVEQTWSSQGKTGLKQLYITVDPANRKAELSESDNNITTSVFVRADTSSPQIQVTFDGRTILYGDLVAARPSILARILDNSPVAITDTSAVHVLLDGERVSFANNLGILSLRPAVETDEARGLVYFTPTLKDGDHTLEILASDASGNRIYHRDDFRVISELRLLRVMNYPNPFYGPTDFTFELTQPAKVTVKVFTVAGRLIAVLDEGWLNAGFNAVHWSGRDHDGDDLANGVYIYKVLASTENEKAEEISKLIVMR